MRIFTSFILLSFLFFYNSLNSKETVINSLKQGGKIIFIRHAYAPGNGDPLNFDLSNCKSQRNLNSKGIVQSKKIGLFFEENSIPVSKVFSSEWCRCKDTAKIAFNKYETKFFLNSFYDERFKKNKVKQIKKIKKFINEWNEKGNLVLVTHYVVISELLDYYPSSGEIVSVDKNLSNLETYQIDY